MRKKPRLPMKRRAGAQRRSRGNARVIGLRKKRSRRMKMPIYEFHCKQCRQEFKTLRALRDLPDVTCPTCGTDRVARLLSVTAQTRPVSESCALPMGGG